MAQTAERGETLSERISHELRHAIVAELAAHSLDEPERLAAALGVPLLTARGILKRSTWSIEDAAWIVNALQLPLTIRVVRSRDGVDNS